MFKILLIIQVQMPALDGNHLRQVIIEAFDWEEGKAGNIVLDDIEYLKDTVPCIRKC